MNAIIIFFCIHWFTSIFAQSFYLHRFAAHSMFQMSLFWNRFFYIFTWIAQGSSFLNPRAYAILHMEHHKHSDTEEDPHSPYFFKDVLSMMLHTKEVYLDIKDNGLHSEKALDKSYPVWPIMDKISDSWTVRFLFAIAYTLFYVAFAPSPVWFVLLPVHMLIGPIHGAFVNWCGHKYGYTNYANGDHSRNTFPWDFLFMGECFQNNHHRYPRSINFAKKWYEFDFAYPFIIIMNRLGIIRISKTQSEERLQ